jgi:hypothetical protein
MTRSASISSFVSVSRPEYDGLEPVGEAGEVEGGVAIKSISCCCFRRTKDMVEVDRSFFSNLGMLDEYELHG